MYGENGIKLKQFVITENDGSFPFELGPHILIMLCFTIAVFRRIVPEMKKEYIFFFIIGLLMCFMATKYFPWKILPETFSIIQFPWRLFVISSFCLSFICAINLGIVIKNFKFIDCIVISVISISYIMALKGFIPTTKEELVAPKDLDYGFVSGINTDCLVGTGKNEYLPKNAYDNYFYVAVREDNLIALEGNANFKNVVKKGNKLTAEINILEENTLIELPYIYYPGYTVTIDGHRIPAFESKNGFLSIGILKPEKYDLKIEYTGTTIAKTSTAISIISFVVFIIYNVYNIKMIKKKENS